MVSGTELHNWFNRHVAAAPGGAAGVFERLRRDVQPKVAAAASPRVVLRAVLTALSFVFDRYDGFTDPKVFTTVAYHGLYLTHGPYALQGENKMVGGGYCHAGTHMPSCDVLVATERHPRVEAELGCRPSTTSIYAAAVVAQLTFACMDSDNADYSTSFERACRNNRKMLAKIEFFGKAVKVLASDRSHYSRMLAAWKRPQGGYDAGDCDVTCLHCTDTEFSGDTRSTGQRERLYQLWSRKLGEGYVRLPGKALRHGEALEKLRAYVEPVLTQMREAHAEFNSSGSARDVLIVPSSVLELHRMRPTWELLVASSSSYFPAPKDPGPVDKPNPRYQPDKGKKARRTFGVPHPAAGTPLGDWYEHTREVSTVANEKRPMDPRYNACKQNTPFPGEPEPPPKPPKPPRPPKPPPKPKPPPRPKGLSASDPNVRERNWTDADVERLIELRTIHGTNSAVLSQLMGTRTSLQIRNKLGHLTRCALKPKPPPKRKRAKLAAPPRSIEADPRAYTTTRADRALR